jgi:hypothetical protein
MNWRFVFPHRSLRSTEAGLAAGSPDKQAAQIGPADRTHLNLLD